MQIELSVVIAIAAVCWSAGLFIGMFTSKFVTKKHCGETSQLMWDRIDELQKVLMGGKISFELRMIRPDESKVL